MPIRGPKGKVTSGVGDRGQSLGQSACGWRPVGCRLARGTSPFPTQSWQDSRFMSSSATACRKHVPLRATGHWPVHWGHPSGKGGLGGAGRAPRLAHCGQPPCSVDWRFSRLAPCGPDGPNTSLWGKRAPAQTRTHSSSSLRLRARAQGGGTGREQRSRCRAPGRGSQSRQSRECAEPEPGIPREADPSAELLEEVGQKWKRSCGKGRERLCTEERTGSWVANQSTPASLHLPPDAPQAHRASPRSQDSPAPGPLHVPFPPPEVPSQPFLTTPSFKASSQVSPSVKSSLILPN